MILGESGTGKELIARAIHEHSPARKDNKFVAVNCAALPENLLESELFGHEKGAFTGATERRIGMFEYASGGTLFLDEIGEMPLSMQAKLIRVLQEREFTRLGSNKTIKTDVRVISATNRDLKELVEKRLFREDLYFRLSVFPIILPPLRDRREDILPLCRFFIEKHSKAMGYEKYPNITKEAYDILMHYDWPGNVRELENTIERALVQSMGETIFPHHLTPSILTPKKEGSITDLTAFEGKSLPEVVSEVEKKIIGAALEKYNNNLSEIAKALEIGRSTLYRKIEQYGLVVEPGDGVE
jgi:transcriptional regulator with PAS, ATPase and Fis domain